MFAASKTATPAVGGYQISRSLRFNSADSTSLTRTFTSAGNQKTWTWSSWIKKNKNTGADTIFSVAPTAGLNISILLYTTNILEFYVANAVGTDWSEDTSAVYRDNSSWYHVVLSVDTTQATAANRLRWYVNGVQQSTVQTYGQIPQNQDTFINQISKQHGIGRNEDGPSSYADFYLAEVYFIDGQALTPSSFGETNAQTGVWQPKAFAGTYGTNGFYLNFSDNSNTTAATLGKDYSGNGNNWTPNNFSVTAGAGNDSLVDSPTSYGTDTGVGGTVRGNYATWNLVASSSYVTLSNGNLDALGNTAADNGCLLSTIGVTSGKWYWEETISNVVTAYPRIGAMFAPATNGVYPGRVNGVGYAANGNIERNGSTVTTVASFTTNDVIGMALDLDNLTIAFYKNNTLQYTATALTAGTYFLGAGQYNGSTSSVNFGQRPFAYTAPSGFKALCTQNLPTPTIGATTATQATNYFNPVLWTGDNTTNRNIAVGFEPDLVWTKGRNSASWSHFWQDRLRGFVNFIQSPSTAAETTTTPSIVSGTYSSGFTIQNNGNSNNTGSTYVAWNWKANGSGSTNTAGSITSTVSANTTSGFSVVTYTGNSTNATVGHGLGVAPSMVIVKVRSTTDGWFVYNQNIGNTQYLRLNTTDAAATFNLWQSTSPTSTVFSIATDPTVNLSGATYVAYCFAPVAGYSAFGSYTGNGSADGPMVYFGFRPAFVMLKNTTTAGNDWQMIDVARGTYNVLGPTLVANGAGSENTYTICDFVSNGVKFRDTNQAWNKSGDLYIYMAFASNPFKYSLAR